MNHTKQFLFGCLAVVALLAHLRQLHAAEERRSSLAAAVGVATENVGRGISYSSEKPAVFGRIAWRGGDFELAAAAITVSGGTANVEVAVAARYYFLVDRFELRAQIEHTAYPGAEPNIDYWEFGLNIRREWETFALELGLRESPDDIAKLKPESSATRDATDSGKFGDRVDGGSSHSAPSSGRRGASNLPVAQKAELWVASLSEPNKVDRIYNAAVIWRLENVGGGPGEAVGSAIRGDVDIPDAKMKMSLVFRKNTDPTLSASHTINVSFMPAKDSPLGGVKAIGPIQMRRADAQSGEKVVGIPVPITENNFLIGLMKGDREARNVQLLRSLAVIDLPLQFNDGRAATINMEKGASGERVFADAIDAWGK